MTEVSRTTSERWKKVETALLQATKVAVQRAKQTGTPVIVWEDGQIKELPPEHFAYLMEEADGPPADQK